MFNPMFVKLPGKDAATVVDVVLIAPTAIDIYSLQRFQVVNVVFYEVDRVVFQPSRKLMHLYIHSMTLLFGKDMPVWLMKYCNRV